MRKLAFVVGGIVVGAVAGLLVLSGRGLRTPPALEAQQAAGQAPGSDSLTAHVIAAGDSSKLQGPVQPIFFRHDIHAGKYKIQCQYCHYSVAVSSEPGIPSLQTCMGCHMMVTGKDSTHRAEIKKLADAWRKKEPVQWKRVHFLPRYAHFPHQRHIKALGPNACATCHGDVQRMPRVYKVNQVDRMGFCVTCHLQRNVSRDCSVCHY